MFLKRFAVPSGASALRVQSVVGLVGVSPVRFVAVAVAVAVTWRPAIMFDKAVNTSVLAPFYSPTPANNSAICQCNVSPIVANFRSASSFYVRSFFFFLRHFMLLPVAGVLSLKNEIRQWQLASYQSLCVCVCVWVCQNECMYIIIVIGGSAWLRCQLEAQSIKNKQAANGQA